MITKYDNTSTNNVQIVILVIKNPLIFFGKIFQKKQTPLHLAASAGQESVCTLLIDLGASLDATDDYGQKPIHLAAQSNKATVVKTLLKQRPNLVRILFYFLDCLFNIFPDLAET